MVKFVRWALISAFFMVVPVSPAPAASFALPDDAVIDVAAFAFPATKITGAYRDNGVDLSSELQQQVVAALQKAGFAIADPGEAPGTAGREPEQAETGAPGGRPGFNPALVRSQTAPVSPGPKEPGEEAAAAAKAAEEAGKIADEAERAAEEANEKAAASGSDADRKKADELTRKAEAASLKAEEAEERAANLAEKTEQETPPGEREKAAESDVTRKEPQYRLTGKVTLYNERVGSPARVGTDIRITVETSLRCTFRIVDMATGKVIISQAASGSGNSVVRDDDVDGALQRLQERAFSIAANDIASRISGKNLGNDDSYVEENYQDSPGKRLRPETR